MKMSGRTPSFIVVGLVIIMFLLALFYSSCSSKNAELRSSLEQFEERIRSLTIKNSEADKTIERLTARKRELEEEILTVRRQMEKKDSEINDINTKLNEKVTELRSLKSDKDVIDQQLKDYASMGETIALKNSLIERLQQQLNSEKEFGVNEQSRLKQEIETLKTRALLNESSQTKEQQNLPQGSNQRFPPLLSNNLTTKSLASLFQDRGENLNNLSREVKPNIVPASIENKEKSLNVLGNDTNQSNAVSVNQAAPNNSWNQPENQNVPAPPIANVDRDSQQQQGNRVESAQGAPDSAQAANREKLPSDQQAARQERGAENVGENNKVDPAIDDEDEDEMDDEDRVDKNVQSNLLSTTTTPIGGNRLSNDHAPSAGKSLNRISERKRSPKRRSRLSEKRRFENGEEAADDDGVRGRIPGKRNNF